MNTLLNLRMKLKIKEKSAFRRIGMCEQCHGAKTIWVRIKGISQCQPCLKCNYSKELNTTEEIREKWGLTNDKN